MALTVAFWRSSSRGQVQGSFSHLNSLSRPEAQLAETGGNPHSSGPIEVGTYPAVLGR